MKIGLVGYQGSGKSSLFHWLTCVEPDPAASHTGQTAMCSVPEPRVDQLCEIYSPKKVTLASLEIVDTPGLSRSHEGNAQRLATIREAECMILVIGAYDGTAPEDDIRSFEEDLMIADMEIVTGRVGRIEDQLKRPIPKADREKLEFELETLQMVLKALEAGEPIREDELTEEQQKATRTFRLLSEKPRMVVVNTADDEEDPKRFESLATERTAVMAVSIGLELELSKMSAEERTEFLEEMGLTSSDRDALVRQIMDSSQQMLFFTAGEKEVRTWMIRQGSTAVEAAGEIHTDMARGFIRAEIMKCADLVRLGGEREVKAEGLVRKEPKDYVIQDDDVILFHFSV